MSQFQRRGTVSKSSGPVHVNSYALKGVPIKYTPPFFLPDQLTLPASWSLPKLPSDDLFRYDYSLERRVLEQVRIRTISFAAEAQAREKREEEEEKKRRIEAAAAAERAKVSSSTSFLQPPLIPSPANTSSNNTSNDSGAPLNKESAVTSGILVKDSTNALKPLGEMCLSEFEGDNFNPFDATSLQAINDMEVLQTISLAPPQRNVGTNTPQVSSSHTPRQSVVTDGRSAVVAPAPNVSSANVSVNSDVGPTPPPTQIIPIQFSPKPSPLPPISAPSQPVINSNSAPSTSVLSTSPHQQMIHPPSLSSLPTHPHPSLPTLPILPPISTNVNQSHSEPTNTNTYPIMTPSSSNSQTRPTPQQRQQYPPMSQGTPTPLPQTNPQQPTPQQYPPMSQGTPTTLPQTNPQQPTHSMYPPMSQGTSTTPSISLSSPHTSTAPNTHTQNVTPYPSLPQSTHFPTLLNGPVTTPYPPTQPTVIEGSVGTLVNLGDDDDVSTTPTPSQQQASPPVQPPVPKPRTALLGRQPVPNSAHLSYPAGPTSLPNPPTVSPKPSSAKNTVQARASSLLATLPQGQPRPGLGVAVLPPIPTPSSSSSPPTQLPPSRGHSSPSVPTPPSYQEPSGRSASPPPPYYASSNPHNNQSEDMRRFSQPLTLPSQQPPSSHFTLPDPQSTMSPEERSEVKSIASMGFPAPRVARAVRRFNSDRTKVVDFLILVGGLEESSGSKGDSAEVALTVCGDDDTKAKRYLQKVTYYRESGFNEKNIHDAYEQAGKHWDRALDILTQDTAT